MDITSYIMGKKAGGGGGGYVLPPATSNTLGGIKVGDNLSIDGSGVLSAAAGSGFVTNDYEKITNGQYTYKVFTLAEHDPGWYMFVGEDKTDVNHPIYFRGTTDDAYDKGYALYNLDFLLYIPKKYSEVADQEYAAFIYQLRPYYGGPSYITVQSGYRGLMRITQMPNTEAGVTVTGQAANNVNIGYATTSQAGTVIVGNGLQINNGYLSTTGGGSQIDITDIIDAYENDGSPNKYTYTFSSESDVNTLDDAIIDANGKPLIATITIGDDNEYVDVINYAYRHDSNEDIYYETFYICRECGFDYNAGTVTILHIKGTLIYEDTVNSKVEIIKEVKTIS